MASYNGLETIWYYGHWLHGAFVSGVELWRVQGADHAKVGTFSSLAYAKRVVRKRTARLGLMKPAQCPA